ncbi:MAG: O-antigen ligase family protein [Clostridia bacterium]|nr:O-antigen ligase family protein [Clostridia bacterium]
MFLSILDSFSSALYNKIASSATGHFFSGKRESADPPGFFEKIGLSGISKKLHTFRKAVSRTIETSRILKAVQNFVSGLVETRLKVYGWFLLSFGIYSGAVSLFRFLITGITDPDFIEYACSVSSVIVSVPLLYSKKTLIQALSENRFTRYLITDVIGFRDSQFERLTGSRGKSSIAFVAGLLLGLCSYLLSPLDLLMFILLTAAAYLVLCVPEFGIMIILFIVPVSSVDVLLKIVIYTSVSYFIKLFRGKRIITLRVPDVLMTLFAAMLIFGGRFSAAQSDSMGTALTMAGLLLAYFVCVNLLNTPELLRRACKILIASSMIVSLIRIYFYFENFFSGAEQIAVNTSDRIASVLDSASVLSQYSVIMLPIAIAMLISEQSVRERLLDFIACVLIVADITISMSGSAWIAAGTGVLIFLFFLSRKTVTAAVFGGLAVTAVHFAMPSSVLEKISGMISFIDLAAADRLFIWTTVSKISKDYFFTGIGVGNEAFAQVFPLYSGYGLNDIYHAHNLFMQILVELGIFGLIVLAVIAVSSCRDWLSFETRTEGVSRSMVLGGMCGVIASLIQGFMTHTWYSYRIFLLFWVVFAITSAFSRIRHSGDYITETGREHDSSFAQIDISTSTTR